MIFLETCRSNAVTLPRRLRPTRGRPGHRPLRAASRDARVQATAGRGHHDRNGTNGGPAARDPPGHQPRSSPSGAGPAVRPLEEPRASPACSPGRAAVDMRPAVVSEERTTGRGGRRRRSRGGGAAVGSPVPTCRFGRGRTRRVARGGAAMARSTAAIRSLTQGRRTTSAEGSSAHHAPSARLGPKAMIGGSVVLRS